MSLHQQDRHAGRVAQLGDGSADLHDDELDAFPRFVKHQQL
jgi:hypothetical protein